LFIANAISSDTPMTRLALIAIGNRTE